MAATVALNLFAFRIITLNAEIFQNGNKRLEQTHHRGGKKLNKIKNKKSICK